MDPTIRKDKWTCEEDLILLRKQSELGNKWIDISGYLSGRPESQVKNRFKSLLKKGEYVVKADYTD